MGENSRDVPTNLSPALMPEWRRDPITGQWVIISPERGTRAVEAVDPLFPADDPERCPFCAGHEYDTPPELFAIRGPQTAPNDPSWQVRVVPNRYPALRKLPVAHPLPLESPLAPGYGKHELIIECPTHDPNLAALPIEQLHRVVIAWHQRMRDLSQDRTLAYGHLFKNHGVPAGASVFHAHSQLIALPLIPPFLQSELDASRRYFSEHGRCVFCDLIHRELHEETRVVHRSAEMIAIAAYAGRQPYETWILPTTHEGRFEFLDSKGIAAVAQMLSTVLRKFDRVAESPAYNLILHTSPFHQGSLSHYHWHFELVPRLTQAAGFEWGTGIPINTMRPEVAAARLRVA